MESASGMHIAAFLLRFPLDPKRDIPDGFGAFHNNSTPRCRASLALCRHRACRGRANAAEILCAIIFIFLGCLDLLVLDGCQSLPVSLAQNPIRQNPRRAWTRSARVALGRSGACSATAHPLPMSRIFSLQAGAFLLHQQALRAQIPNQPSEAVPDTYAII
jgi:hypothetical protein